MRSKVNHGRRHQIVNIYEITYDLDEEGFPIETKTLKETLYAEVRTISTKEFISASGRNDLLTNKFVMPRLEYLSTGSEIEWDNKIWNIQHIHYIDNWNMEITAVLMGNTTE